MHLLSSSMVGVVASSSAAMMMMMSMMMSGLSVVDATATAATITCTFAVDNIVENVYLDGSDITSSVLCNAGSGYATCTTIQLGQYTATKKISFTEPAGSYTLPGSMLAFRVADNTPQASQANSGLLLKCVSSASTGPWHGLISDTTSGRWSGFASTTVGDSASPNYVAPTVTDAFPNNWYLTTDNSIDSVSTSTSSFNCYNGANCAYSSGSGPYKIWVTDPVPATVYKYAGLRVCVTTQITNSPTHKPSASPTNPTLAPTKAPTDAPTTSPTWAPTDAPTTSPTWAPTTAPTAAPTTPAPTQSQFIFVHLGKNYDDANNFCKSTFGTQLATVDTAAKQAILDSEFGGTYFWIGLNDISDPTTPTWAWESGSELGGYSHWSSTPYIQPDNYGGDEQCVHVWVAGYWNDADCTKYLPFVCDRKHSTFKPARGPL